MRIKITKRQLKRIIREEKKRLLNESGSFLGRGAPSPMKSRVDPEFARAIKGNTDLREPRDLLDALAQINDMVGHALTNGVDPLELANELRGLADDVEDSAEMLAEPEDHGRSMLRNRNRLRNR